MSSKAVREAFRHSWTTKVPSIPYYESINDDPDHTSMPTIWATCEYLAFNEEQVSLGNPSCRRESGTITVVIVTDSGIGDETLITAAEAVRNAYRYWTSGGIRVTQVDPPIGPGFSDGNYYIMEVDITYQYDTYI